MVQTVRCVRCTADLPATAKYCPKCGTPADLQYGATVDSDAAATLDDSSPPRRNLLDTRRRICSPAAACSEVTPRKCTGCGQSYTQAQQPETSNELATVAEIPSTPTLSASRSTID